MNSQVTVDILNRLAERKGVEPADVDLVLDDHIDTEALERLASHETTSWTLSFRLPDHVVTVTEERVVSVDPIQYESSVSTTA